MRGKTVYRIVHFSDADQSDDCDELQYDFNIDHQLCRRAGRDSGYGGNDSRYFFGSSIVQQAGWRSGL